MFIQRCLVIMLGVIVPASAADWKDSARTPQFPLKDARQLFSDEAIALAHENVAAYPSAAEIVKGILDAAEPWLAWEDKELRDLIPASDVPRAFNVGTAGCPKCGTKIYEKGGTYPWIIDVKKPFKVECPVCGGVFPDNDFEAYYRSGFQDKQYLEGDYADDGWGWHGPDDRYWFVGYANHWTWHSHIRPAVLNLARAYTLTSDKRYAHKAVVMLDRIAEVYPGMDYHNQSRYGALVDKRGGHYGGKIVNLIWETGMLTNLAEAYDAVWETIDADADAQTAAGKTGEEIRATIEANLLEEGIEEVFAQEIRGNFGMHQRALAYAVAARQYGKVDEWLDGIFTYSGPAYTQTGLNYALYDLVFRDGLPFETSPGYNWGWVANITTVAETLKRAGRDVYAIPKMKRLYDGVLDMHAARAFTPALGDSGNVYGGMIGCDGRVFQAAYRAYRDPRFYRHLAAIDATGDASFVSYESLFHPAVEAGAAEFPAQASRLLDGYGMAILNNPADSIAATLYYGFKGGHGHFDRLHFDIFANGRPMLPDLGYPDFMNVYVSGIYTWSQNTINHNTVTVDARRQSSNLAGSVRAFAVGAFARVVDIDAPGTYAQCTTYRRRLFMIDRDASRSYFIDVFTVDGGRQHDYSLHGPPGAFEVLGGEWLAQEQGTLAGEDVPLGVIYDNAKLGAEGYDGAYSGYAGSGFQHLYNVRRLAQGDWVAQWTHEKDPEARLRIRTLGQPGQQIILANAQVSPVKHKQVLTYLIARCQGDEPMSSRFVSVIEPYAGAPFIQRAELLPVAEEGLAVRVTFDDGAQDIVLCEAAGVEKPETDAAYAVLRTDPEGAATDAFMAYGTHLDGNGIRLGAGPTTGTVVSVKPCFEGPPAPPEINVKLDGAPPALEQAAIAHFSNALRQTVHPIARASQRDGLYVLETADDVLVGRARITGIEADALLTDTVLHFASLYAGAYAADEAFSSFRVIEKVKGGRIQLAEPLPEGQPFVTGRDVWIVNVGPGDRLDIPATAEYTSLKKQEGATP